MDCSIKPPRLAQYGPEPNPKNMNGKQLFPEPATLAVLSAQRLRGGEGLHAAGLLCPLPHPGFLS